jgi:hypothetical protein
MSTAQAESAYCNAKKRRGGRCHLPAGWGTPHVGRGPCRKHLGNAPNVVRHHTAVMAIDFARGTMAEETATDPLQAMLQSVRLASGIVRYWRRQIAEAEETTAGMQDSYERALRMLNGFSKAALDADVNDRLVRIAEREADPIVLAFEEALAEQPQIATTVRAALVQSFERALEKTVAIEGEAVELTV